jgi:hypothetical protein
MPKPYTAICHSSTQACGNAVKCQSFVVPSATVQRSDRYAQGAHCSGHQLDHFKTAYNMKAACWFYGTAYTVLRYCIHCVAILHTLCCGTACTVLPYCMHCVAVLHALCCRTACTVLPYCIHCVAVLHTLCCRTAYTVLWYCIHCVAVLHTLCYLSTLFKKSNMVFCVFKTTFPLKR